MSLFIETFPNLPRDNFEEHDVSPGQFRHKILGRLWDILVLVGIAVLEDSQETRSNSGLRSSVPLC